MASNPSMDHIRAQGNALIKKIQANTLLVKSLQNICHLNGLGRSGVKADLQKRIIKHINDCVARGDFRAFSEIEASVRDNSSNPSGWPGGYSSKGQTASPHYYATSQSAADSPYAPQPGYGMVSNSYSYSPGGAGVNGHKSHQSPHQSLLFKSSPFYEIISSIGEMRVCDAMSQHRNTIAIPIRLQDHPELQQCVTDSTMKVMVFCAADRIGAQDIAFPHQSELKVNGGEVKANLRGLKNKPGSTRPVDITSALRLKPSYTNNVEYTYALTNKASRRNSSSSKDVEKEKYFLALFLCRTTPVPVLVSQIEKGVRIRKATVINDITRKAQDPDVVATAQVLSLKCPLTYMRLSLPCRAQSCSHIQCFDATSYLQLQEQGPQWLCPICNKPAPFKSLAVDEYVRDILDNTSKSVDQVTIETDGRWSTQGSQKESEAEAPEMSFIKDDDGIMISADVSIVRGWDTSTPNRSATSIGTPMTGASRESSTMPRSSTSSKRPHAEVIDLTGSDDDDVAPPPSKRLNLRPDNGAFMF